MLPTVHSSNNCLQKEPHILADISQRTQEPNELQFIEACSIAPGPNFLERYRNEMKLFTAISINHLLLCCINSNKKGRQKNTYVEQVLQ